ncbi:MAG: hypothetical protein QOJ63_437 [Solirubrobacteraceae bacterium]|jgi:hypothetical protein|nr:hypothetical protein [Solirubrobacteraceae bacterium]
MPDDPAPRRRSGFLAFWTSLPGVLTGVAAVIAAVGGLAAVFDGGGEGSSGRGSGSDGAPQVSTPAAPAPAESAPTAELSPGDAAAAGEASAGCFGGPFAGIPQGRLAPVEAGTTAFDIVTSSEPKAGAIGLRFTDQGRTIGGIKVTWYPVNDIFRVESVLDAKCQPVGDYANVVDRGQNDVMQNADALRIRLAGHYYDLRLNGGAEIRVVFLQVEP